MLTLLILATLAATILAGCGGGPSRPDAEQEASGTAGSSTQKTGGTDSSGRTAAKQLGHPALGAADAPVVLTEYSDYQ